MHFSVPMVVHFYFLIDSYKRLEKELFKMPKIIGKAMEITMEQMQWLLSGLNIEKIKGFKKLKYKYFY